MDCCKTELWNYSIWSPKTLNIILSEDLNQLRVDMAVVSGILKINKIRLGGSKFASREINSLHIVKIKNFISKQSISQFLANYKEKTSARRRFRGGTVTETSKGEIKKARQQNFAHGRRSGAAASRHRAISESKLDR